MKKSIFYFLAVMSFFSFFNVSNAEAGLFKRIRRSIKRTITVVVRNPRCAKTLISVQGIYAKQAIQHLKSRGLVRSRKECNNVGLLASKAASYYHPSYRQYVMQAGKCVCLRVFR